jgi:myo-inositol-1(or 4)-monophosphatase
VGVDACWGASIAGIGYAVEFLRGRRFFRELAIFDVSAMVRRVSALVELAVETARAAGEALARLYETGLAVEKKSSEIDLVTEADRLAEAIIVERLRAARPDIAVLAEETGARAGTSSWRWLVDPLDGTTNFAHGFPHFSVSIALYDEGEREAPGAGAILGCVHDPLRGETFVASSGEGGWLISPRGRRRLAVTQVETLGESILATGFGYDRATTRRNNLDEFNRLIPQVQGIRRAGSAALDLAYVAAGRLDGYWELGLAPWDWGAGAILVREAGGLATTFEGEVWRPGDDSMIAAGPRLHAKLGESLRA